MINIQIQKKDLWLLAAIMVFLVGVGYVIAYDWTTGTGTGQPSIHGHTANEIEGLNVSVGHNNCEWVTTTAAYFTLTCPAGKYVAGIRTPNGYDSTQQIYCCDIF